MKFMGFDEYKNRNITREELFEQWQNYVDEYKTEEVDPILKRMQQAKNDYFNAAIDFQEKMVEFGKEHSEAADITDRLNLGGAKSINVEPVHNPESFIRSQELTGLAIYTKQGKRTFKGVTR